VVVCALGGPGTSIAAVTAAPAHPVASRVEVFGTGSQPDDFYGWGVANVGDVNGDGHDDFAVSAAAASNGRGRVYLYFGGPEADTTADMIFNGPGFCCSGLGPAAGAGDVNGDGHADLIVGAGGYNTSDSLVRVYYGGPALDTIPDITLLGTANGQTAFGLSVAGVGDLNQDGFDDVVVGAPEGGLPARGGHAYVYYGKPTGLFGPNVIAGAMGDQLGTSVAGAGDVNGDGFDDFIVGFPQRARRPSARVARESTSGPRPWF
jgi:hypothetical protein